MVKEENKEELKETTDWIEESLVNFLRNARICGKNVHLRFEDDYYSKALPFSLGLLCEV